MLIAYLIIMPLAFVFFFREMLKMAIKDFGRPPGPVTSTEVAESLWLALLFSIIWPFGLAAVLIERFV